MARRCERVLLAQPRSDAPPPLCRCHGVAVNLAVARLLYGRRGGGVVAGKGAAAMAITSGLGTATAEGVAWVRSIHWTTPISVELGICSP